MKTRSMYKAEGMCLDRISTLPQPILETILSLLPTKEASRTSVLSKEWRYKWTGISKLRFRLCKRTSELTSEIASTKKYMDMHDVHQIVLRHQGPIHEFALYMDYWKPYEWFELDQIILHLSRNHIVKELALNGSHYFCFKLPESVFALHHLTGLYLCSFDVDLPSIFNGFGSLGRLWMVDIKISTQTLLHLLSNCPSLKNLRLNIDASGDKCTINALLDCLHVIEHLTIFGDVSKWLVLDSVPQELPTSLIHLKYLRFSGRCYVERYELAFLFVLIKCSPNLERIELEIKWGPEEFSAVKDAYSNVWLEHLNELQICSLNNSLETELVKFILARAPKVKVKKVTTLTW